MLLDHEHPRRHPADCELLVALKLDRPLAHRVNRRQRTQLTDHILNRRTGSLCVDAEPAVFQQPHPSVHAQRAPAHVLADHIVADLTDDRPIRAAVDSLTLWLASPRQVALARGDRDGRACARRALNVHCPGVDHMDFSADGKTALASCEFSAQMVRIDLRTATVSGYVYTGGSPQDVKLSPGGRTFYVANRYLPTLGASGVQLIDAHSFRLVGSRRTRLDAHGLYVSRDTRRLYVTSRAGGAITAIDFATRRTVASWGVPGTRGVPGTPDMGNVGPDGNILWVSGRYSSAVYAISTRTGRVLATVRVGVSPHGLCLWPQPGRYSTGHTGVMR
jgi:YVTN family beta-propeller protein